MHWPAPPYTIASYVIIGTCVTVDPIATCTQSNVLDKDDFPGNYSELVTGKCYCIYT